MNQLFGLQHRNRVFDLKVRSVACAIRCALSTRRETRGVF